MKNPPIPRDVALTLPDWLDSWGPALRRRYPGDADKMRLAIGLAAANVAAGTGGPFGAAVFAAGSGRVVAVGVNRVVPLHNSVAHAEMLAFMLAQRRLGRQRLGRGRQRYVLATSAQPCAMCYGASAWAGVDCLLIGARRGDVESLTEFEEGPLPRNWVAALRRRGITVRRDILRAEACAVLRAYTTGHGAAY